MISGQSRAMLNVLRQREIVRQMRDGRIEQYGSVDGGTMKSIKNRKNSNRNDVARLVAKAVKE